MRISAMPVVTLLDYHSILNRMRNLRSGIVLTATSILMTVSIVRTVVAFSIYHVQDAKVSVGLVKV
jgi:hypothetical protein